MAAIAFPTSLLNELIDEASSYMSEGVSFGSRESLKKSLTVARKSAENGGFKLKCYKNSDSSAKNSTTKNKTVTNLTNKINTTKVDAKLSDLVKIVEYILIVFLSFPVILNYLNIMVQCYPFFHWLDSVNNNKKINKMQKIHKKTELQLLQVFQFF